MCVCESPVCVIVRVCVCVWWRSLTLHPDVCVLVAHPDGVAHLTAVEARVVALQGPSEEQGAVAAERPIGKTTCHPEGGGRESEREKRRERKRERDRERGETGRGRRARVGARHREIERKGTSGRTAL